MVSDSRGISVTLGKNNIPRTFTWRKRDYRVSELQECWRYVGAWWDGEGEMTYFRVLADSGGIYELCYDHARDRWLLNVVQD